MASAKRSTSERLRTKARMTRTPVICSRRTWLIRSIFACILRNSGTTLATTVPMKMAITGTATASSGESAAPSLTANITPPTLIIGAMTMSVSAICTNSWICWMSLVFRVINEGVPKWSMSRAENAWTRENTAARMSAPAPIAVREAQYTATTATAPRPRVMPSMTAPVVRM